MTLQGDKSVVVEASPVPPGYDSTSTPVQSALEENTTALQENSANDIRY